MVDCITDWLLICALTALLLAGAGCAKTVPVLYEDYGEDVLVPEIECAPVAERGYTVWDLRDRWARGW